jgi:hypothetical protein
MTEDPWKAHISYLEAEVDKMIERANKLEAMIPDLESVQKKQALRGLISRLRDDVTENRKFLALVKQK